jgi:hypothetical protein
MVVNPEEYRSVSRIAKGLVLTSFVAGAVTGTAAADVADVGARATAADSAGELTGDVVQVPVYAPVNVCGNTVDFIGLPHPSFGNKCPSA